MATQSDLTNPFGWHAADFGLKDTDGTYYELADLRGPRGLVLVFICNHCPYVKAIADKLRTEGQALMDMGFGFAAICSNDSTNYPADSFENMGKFKAEHGFEFPYLHDETQSVARAYKAACTPDFFGFNANLELAYRGRLDSAGRNPDIKDAPRELFEAMKLIAHTGKGPSEQTPSIGCSIKWKDG